MTNNARRKPVQRVRPNGQVLARLRAQIAEEYDARLDYWRTLAEACCSQRDASDADNLRMHEELAAFTAYRSDTFRCACGRFLVSDPACWSKDVARRDKRIAELLAELAEARERVRVIFRSHQQAVNDYEAQRDQARALAKEYYADVQRDPRQRAYAVTLETRYPWLTEEEE